MPKLKIYDIIPPKKKQEHFSYLSDKSKQTQKKQTRKRQIWKDIALLKGLNWKFSKIKIGLAVLCFLFVLGIFWLFSSAQEAEVLIWPQTNEVSFNTKVEFSASNENWNLAGSDLSEIKIPAVPVEIEEVFKQEFPASTVKVEDKAIGTIKVFNKHSYNVTLIEGTRFLSATEPAKQFHIQKGITIPAGGHIDVQVVASEAGDGYNIEPTTFSVPGLRNFSPPQLYYNVYGKSSEKMKGGRIQEIKKVTEEGLSSAEEQLLKISQEKAKTVLEEKVGKDFRILDESIEMEVIESGPVNAVAGQEKETFIYANRLKIKALKIEKLHLMEFVAAYIRLNIPGTRDLVESSLAVNLFKSTMSGFLYETQINGKIYTKTDEYALKEVIKSRVRSEAVRYAWEVFPEMTKTPQIIFRPFWSRRMPSDSENIELKLIFE
jgi:hypothetical protein